MTKYVAFDLETAQLADSTGHNYALGITCAAAVTSDGVTCAWHGPVDPATGMLTPQMSPGRVLELLEDLWDWVAGGYQLITWNGAAFDLRVIAAELWPLITEYPGIITEVKRLALQHVDPAFTMFAHKGYMIGLNTAAEGLGVAGKLAGMQGDQAVTAWAESRVQQDLVLRYVTEDCAALGRVYTAACQQQGLSWIAKSGRRNTWNCPRIGELTVRDVLAVPEPDTSWMREARSRAELVGWLMPDEDEA